jgi:signal peptidase II
MENVKKKSSKIFRIILVLAILIFNVGCDQLSKSFVRKTLTYNQHVAYLQNHFTIIKVENTGAFLSLGNSLPGFLKIIILMILPSLVLLIGLYLILIKSNVSGLYLVAISFILGGGIGNIFDRIVHGSVTDFLHIDFIIFQTGIFNLADLSIMAGFFIILTDIILQKSKIKVEN